MRKTKTKINYCKRVLYEINNNNTPEYRCVICTCVHNFIQTTIIHLFNLQRPGENN